MADFELELDPSIDAEGKALAERNARRELEKEQEATRKRLLAAGWPARALFYAKRLPDRRTPALDETRIWAEEHALATKLGLNAPRSILVLSGNNGCGKTVAGAWWAQHARSGKATAFLRAIEIPKLPSARLEAAIAAPALMLDDLGTEKLDRRGKVLDFFQALIETFYADQKPLVITTMKTEAELSVTPDKGGRFSGHTLGRLREAGCLRSVPGENLRDRMGES